MDSLVVMPTRVWKWLVLAVAAAIMTIAVAATRAGAYIYVAGPVTSPVRAPSTIERMTLDGSGVQPDFIAGPRVESSGQLRVYAGRLYWLDSSADDCVAKSAALDGTDVQTLTWLQSQPCGSGLSIAVAGGYLYWGAAGPGAIGRVSTEPPYTAQRDFIQLPKIPGSIDRGEAMSLVTDGEWLYWYDDFRDAVGRSKLDGADIDPAAFHPDAGGVVLLGVAQGYVWWRGGSAAGAIGRARPDGSDRDPDYLTGIHAYDGTVTPQSLYFTGSPCGQECSVNIDGAVSRVALEPGATPQLLGNLGDGVGYALAVDSLGDPFPSVRIAKHRDGTATALVSTSGAENVSIRGKRIVHKKAKQLRSKIAGVAIRPRRGARRELRHTGKAHVTVRIVYRSDKGMPQFWKRDITLRLGRR